MGFMDTLKGAVRTVGPLLPGFNEHQAMLVQQQYQQQQLEMDRQRIEAAIQQAEFGRQMQQEDLTLRKQGAAREQTLFDQQMAPVTMPGSYGAGGMGPPSPSQEVPWLQYQREAQIDALNSQRASQDRLSGLQFDIPGVGSVTGAELSPADYLDYQVGMTRAQGGGQGDGQGFDLLDFSEKRAKLWQNAYDDYLGSHSDMLRGTIISDLTESVNPDTGMFFTREEINEISRRSLAEPSFIFQFATPEIRAGMENAAKSHADGIVEMSMGGFFGGAGGQGQPGQGEADALYPPYMGNPMLQSGMWGVSPPDMEPFVERPNVPGAAPERPIPSFEEIVGGK